MSQSAKPFKFMARHSPFSFLKAADSSQLWKQGCIKDARTGGKPKKLPLASSREYQAGEQKFDLLILRSPRETGLYRVAGLTHGAEILMLEGFTMRSELLSLVSERLKVRTSSRQSPLSATCEDAVLPTLDL